MSKLYLLRIGNGNEGNFPECQIEIEDEKDCPWSFMNMVIANLFIVGTNSRRHSFQNVYVDGDDELIYATLHEGPKGETDFGAAYKTAELSLIENDDWNHLNIFTPKEYLDFGAYRKYKKEMRK